MKKLNTILLGLSLLTSSIVFAVPAKRGFIEVTTSDGTTVRVQRVGDEFMHYFVDEAGNVMKQNDAGFYEYATFNTNGQLVASPNRQCQAVNIDFEQVSNARKTKARMRLPEQSGLGRYTSDFPRTGDIRALVILVQYKDVSFTLSDPYTYFNDMLNKPGFNDYGGTGSATDYFLESSTNQFRPVFDVFGPVTLPQNLAYYGANDTYGNDKLPEDMVVHACKQLDATVDFKKYDMDGDGYVDNVYVFYAGKGEASYGAANTVWPHSWELSAAGKAFKLDGVTIDRYACSNEWEQSRPDGIGTFVHEFSHVMGLPDLYHTTSTVYYTPCDYDVLDYGPYNNDGRTPPVYSAFERNAMGWLDPVVITGPETISLDNLADSNKACLIPTNKKNEFFLLENRQQKGWDKYIPGHGMLIWHIDFNQSVWDNNVVNNTKSHQYVDIEEANGNPDGSSTATMKGWTWPGTSYKTSFTDTTSPSMKTWAGVALGLPVTDIDETDGVITFNVAGGKSLIDTPEPQEPTERYNDAFTANWQPVDNAVDYHLTVWCTKGTGAEQTETANMGSNTTLSLPAGWSSSSTKNYSTAGNFGAAKPSLRLDTDGAYLQTKEYDSDITKVSFWHKGQTTSGSTINLQNYDGKTWNTFATVIPTSNKAETAEIAEIPEGTKQLRISYSKVIGNLALDDVAVTYGGETDVVLEHYNERSMGNTTSHQVTGLPEGETKFKYAVCATDGENHSRLSAKVSVDLTGTSAVRAISVDNADAPVEYFNLQGIRIASPSAGQTVIRRQGTSTTKITVR